MLAYLNAKLLEDTYGFKLTLIRLLTKDKFLWHLNSRTNMLAFFNFTVKVYHVWLLKLQPVPATWYVSFLREKKE